jgi:hypothetical protein
VARPVIHATAVCHPDRAHLAHGLCSACYHRKWAGRRGLARRYNVMPSDESMALPARIADVFQFAVDSFPIRVCPHCGHNRFLYSGREAHCAGVLGGCGQTVYLVRREEL